MSHRIIATRDGSIGSVELVEEKEVVTENEELKEILMSWGWARPFDPTAPMPPKGINSYETDKAYPIDRFIVYSGSLYKSKIVTSSTWIASEWDLILQGA